MSNKPGLLSDERIMGLATKIIGICTCNAAYRTCSFIDPTCEHHRLNGAAILAIRIAADEAGEEAARICEAGVTWSPPLSNKAETISRETAYLLAKAIRARLRKE